LLGWGIDGLEWAANGCGEGRGLAVLCWVVIPLGRGSRGGDEKVECIKFLYLLL